MSYLLRFLLLAGLFFFFQSCGKMEAPQFRHLDSFKLKKLGLQKADIGFALTYYNPNRFGVSVKEAEIDVYVDSVYLGKFQQDNQVVVDKKAEFTIPLSGSIPLVKALEINLEDLANREVAVRANGSVKVGKGGIFITRPVTYTGKHKVDFKL